MGNRVSRIWLALAVVAAMLSASPAGWGDVRVGVVLDDVSLGEALLVAAIGHFFGLDTTVVVAYRDRHRLSFSEIVLAMYLARLAGCDHHRVVALHARGHGWGRIANDLGIHPGAFNKMRKGFQPAAAGDRDFEESALIWFLAAYHGASQDDVRRWMGRGHSAPDVFIALDFAAKSGKRPDDLLARRGATRSWHAVGSAVGLSGSDIKQPGKPKGGQEFRGDKASSGQPAGQGHGAASGQGQAHEQHGSASGGKGKGRQK